MILSVRDEFTRSMESAINFSNLKNHNLYVSCFANTKKC